MRFLKVIYYSKRDVKSISNAFERWEHLIDWIHIFFVYQYNYICFIKRWISDFMSLLAWNSSDIATYLYYTLVGSSNSLRLYDS